MKWVDFFASLDPVPNGPLLHAKSEHLESVELSNRMSPIGDHTSYMDNGDEFLPLIVDAIFRFSGTELRPGEFTDADRSRVSSVRWTRVAAETVDQMLLLFALFALLPHGGAYQFAGTSFTDLIDGMCHGVRVEKCWTFSPERTGLGVMISAYIVCRMFVQLAHWLGAVTSRRSDIFRRLAYLAPFASHLISSLAALLVGSLFYSGTFSWIKWLHDNVPQPISYPSAQTLQAIIFACASALGLTIYGHLRVRALEGKP
jgi:hypothetical protein